MDDYVERLLERDDVASEEVVTELDADEFERSRARAREIEGGVAVAVTNDDGAVLLVRNDWMDGFGFPGGGVEPGESYEAAAVREVREETGVAVELDRPWRVQHGIHEHGDERIEVVGWFDAVPEAARRPDLIGEVLDDAG